MNEQYIVIYQHAGSQVDWHTEGYYGPFNSREECQKWMNSPENKLEGRNERYVIQLLSK